MCDQALYGGRTATDVLLAQHSNINEQDRMVLNYIAKGIVLVLEIGRDQGVSGKRIYGLLSVATAITRFQKLNFSSLLLPRITWSTGKIDSLSCQKLDCVTTREDK